MKSKPTTIIAFLSITLAMVFCLTTASTAKALDNNTETILQTLQSECGGKPCMDAFNNCVASLSNPTDEAVQSCALAALNQASSTTPQAAPKSISNPLSVSVHISGTLTCSGSSPVSDQKVNLFSPQSKLDESYTDGSGKYSFNVTVDGGSLPQPLTVSPNAITFGGDPPTKLIDSTPGQNNLTVKNTGQTDQTFNDVNFSFSSCSSTANPPTIDDIRFYDNLTGARGSTKSDTIEFPDSNTKRIEIYINGNEFGYGSGSLQLNNSSGNITLNNFRWNYTNINGYLDPSQFPQGKSTWYLKVTPDGATAPAISSDPIVINNQSGADTGKICGTNTKCAQFYENCLKQSDPTTCATQTFNQSSSFGTSNTIPRAQIENLETQIQNKCANAMDINLDCVTQAKTKCFAGNGIDTTASDQTKVDASVNTSASHDANTAYSQALNCITNYSSTFPVSANVQLPSFGETWAVNLKTGTAPISLNTNEQAACQNGCYMVLNVNYGRSSKTVRFTLTYNSQTGTTTSSGVGGSSGKNSSSASNASSGGATQVLSCTGKCAVCPSGQVEGTVKYGNGTSQGACVGLSSCPSGQQQCTDNANAAASAATCTYSQSCGNGGTQTWNGKYVDGQCRYVAGYSTAATGCQGEVGAANRVCTPGSYSAEKFIGCDGSQAKVQVQQCSSDGTAWGSYGNPYYQPNMSYKCTNSSAPQDGSSCTYPESCPNGGAHTCTGTIQGGSCKYNPGVDPNCSACP